MPKLSVQYQIIIDQIGKLSLEDKQDLLDDLQDLIQADLDDLPHQGNHFDEHQRVEMQALAG